MTSPAENVLAVVAEFGADLQAAAKNAIDAIRETAATSQESYALAPPHPGTFIALPPEPKPLDPMLAYAPIDPASLGLGAVVRANFMKGRFVLVHAAPGDDESQWWSLQTEWVCNEDLTDVEVLHPGIDVPA